MVQARVQRRLAAILATDMVGYARLMEVDERGIIDRQKLHRADLIDPKFSEHGGRIVKSMGDGLLVEFASVVDAVRCAVEVQMAMIDREADTPEERRIRYRVGINLGDIIIDSDDILGDGVNIAARIEALAQPGGICLSDDAYRQILGKLEVTFEDAGEQALKNIARPVRVWHWVSGAEPERVASLEVGRAASKRPEKPSIAVLPFDNMSGDTEQDYFADGLVEDITTTLSKLSGLTVIARNSSFAYKHRAVDVRQVAKELGVRYILEGSVRRSGNRIRITAQLIDARDGAHVWADRFDRQIDDIFAVQDEIMLVLATEMQVKLTEGEQARIHYTTTSNVAAWTHWAQGMAHFRQPITKDEFGQARFCWEKALSHDPGSAVLNAMLGFMHYIDARFGWWNDRETAIRLGQDYTDRALELDPESPDAHSSASMLLMLQGRYEEAVAGARKALQMAPGCADTAAWASMVLASSGFPEEAVMQIERAMTLSPNYPPNYLGHLGNCYRLSGRTSEAIAAFRDYAQRAPGFGLADLVIAHHEAGQTNEARKVATELLTARPYFTIESWRNTQFRKDEARLAADLDALRLAGIPLT